MRGGNGNGGEIPEGNIYFVYNSTSFYTNFFKTVEFMTQYIIEIEF